MQILGKRSKMLLAALLAVILITLGTSFAVWDGQAVLAATGDAASYANAKVGEVIQFGRYWQKDVLLGYDDKDPIDWIVVDKDERTGQLTLLSKYILAYGSYFGNDYSSGSNSWGDGGTKALVGSISYNQAWSESTARAFLNNLERFDLGGDKFDATNGLSSERTASVVADKKLKASAGFSNARYYTGLSPATEGVQALIDNSATTGIYRLNDKEAYYQRPKVTEPAQRLARNGFLDEAFSPDEKQMIVPKEIPGQISHRWPAKDTDFLDTAEYIPGTKDKVWLPSVEELNIKAGIEAWTNSGNDSWTHPSELESSTPFEYFKNYEKYTGQSNYKVVVKTTGTAFASAAGSLGNYSIPGWITDVGNNATGHYWTRSAPSYWSYRMRLVTSWGQFDASITNHSAVGVRPCIILQY